MIQVGDLIKLKTSENRSISMRNARKDELGCRKEIAYTRGHPPVLILGKNTSNNPNDDRPHKVKVLHDGQIWIFRFKWLDSLETFFRKVNP